MKIIFNLNNWHYAYDALPVLSFARPHQIRSLSFNKRRCDRVVYGDGLLSHWDESPAWVQIPSASIPFLPYKRPKRLRQLFDKFLNSRREFLNLRNEILYDLIPIVVLIFIVFCSKLSIKRIRVYTQRSGFVNTSGLM
jgi:hypothetical protein